MFSAIKLRENLILIKEQEDGSRVDFYMQFVIGTKKAALIDCGLRKDENLLKLLRMYTSLPIGLYLTHGHQDHIGNAAFFSEIHIGEDDAALLGEGVAYIPLSHGECIDLGGIALEAYALSGHSKGAFCFLNKQEGYALTGDVINHETWLCWDECDTPLQYAEKVARFYETLKEYTIDTIYEGHSNEPIAAEICMDMITALHEISEGSVKNDPAHHTEQGKTKNAHTYGASTIIYDKERMEMKKGFKITPDNIPNDGIMFVDNESRYRSGHMGHALVEYAENSMLAFFSNCSGAIERGHTGYGWMEYKRTTDGGKTWSEAKVLDYSWNCFIDGVCNISCEKAVATDDGTIVLFCLRNKKITRWEPYLEPTVLRSFDGGEHWTEAKLMTHYRGRVMDVMYKDGVIYALMFCNDAEIFWTGNRPEHLYRMFVSKDNGETFEELSVLPFDTQGRHYGTMELLPDGGLIVYNYNLHDEYHSDYCISYDMAKSWSTPSSAFFAKRLRNPQMCQCGGIYFMHGRSGNESTELPFHFVLYTSENGIDWDEGEYMRITPPKGNGTMAYYSNNCVTGRFGGKKRVLIQASDSYDDGRVNVKHWWIDTENA